MSVDRLGPEAAFRLLVEQSPFSTQIHTADGACVFVNQAWERLWGVTLEHIQGYNILEDQQLVDKGIMSLIQRGFAGETVAIPPIKYETELTRPGSGAVPYRWVSAYLYPIFDAEGRVALVAMTGEDVTARIEAEARVRDAEEQYRSIFEATGDALIIADLDGYIVEANPAACRIYGYTRDELVGLHSDTITRQDYRREIPEAARATVSGGIYQTRAISIRKDGTPFPVEALGASFVYMGKPHVLGVMRDVTELVKAQEELEQRVAERTRELATLLDVSRNVASTLELHPLLDLILDQLKTVVPYDGAAVLAASGGRLSYLVRRAPTAYVDIPPEGEHPSWMEPIIATIRAGTPVVIDDVRGDSPLARAFREHAPALMETMNSYVRSWMGIPMTVQERWTGIVLLASSTPHFYTARHAELALAIARHAAIAVENARLYERAQEVAVLEERQRLSRELHDSISQVLYSIALGTRTAQSLLEPASHAAAPMEFVLAQAERGLAEMRALIFEIRPETLAEEGLVAALQRQANAVTARYQLPIELALCEEPPAPLAAKEALYRIAQEALQNTVKHARASRVRLRLECQDGEVVLEVRDDGRGFDPRGAFPGHLGLRSMDERARRLGGTVQVESAPDAGARVCARIPWTAEP